MEFVKWAKKNPAMLIGDKSFLAILFCQMKYAVDQIREREVDNHVADNRNHRLHCARGNVVYHARQVGYRDVADDARPLNQIYDRRLIDGLGDTRQLRERDELKRLQL